MCDPCTKKLQHQVQFGEFLLINRGGKQEIDSVGFGFTHTVLAVSY